MTGSKELERLGLLKSAKASQEDDAALTAIAASSAAGTPAAAGAKAGEEKPATVVDGDDSEPEGPDMQEPEPSPEPTSEVAPWVPALVCLDPRVPSRHYLPLWLAATPADRDLPAPCR